MDAILNINSLNLLKSLDVIHCEFIDGHMQFFDSASQPAADFRKFNPPAEYSFVYLNALVTVLYNGSNATFYTSIGSGIVVPKIDAVTLPCASMQINNGVNVNTVPRYDSCTINFKGKYISYVQRIFNGSNNGSTYIWPGIQFIYFA